MKDLIINEDREPRYIINRVLRGTGHNTIALFPNYDTICKILRNHRIKIKNPAPQIYPTLKVGESPTTTVLNTPFYRYGVDNYDNVEENDDIRVFYSDHAATRLFREDIWCVDGTFSAVPSPYYQLYTIIFIKDNPVSPCIFGLLKNKKLETYKGFFRVVLRRLGNYSPRYIKTDLEPASISAPRFSFHLATISGRQFHLAQAVQGKIQEIRLIAAYRTSYPFRWFTKALSALRYVEPVHTEQLFHEIRRHPEFPPSLHPIFEYFFNNCSRGINSTRFPLDLWNSLHTFTVDSLIRTNIAIEGWHSVFKSIFCNFKSSMAAFPDRFKEEEEVIRIKMIRSALGYVFRRRNKYIIMVVNVLEFLSEYSTGPDEVRTY